jgi:hypothetical protein
MGRYLQLEYNPKLISLALVKSLLNSYKSLLEEIIQTPR